MKLLYISTFMFREENNKFFGLPSCADSFFGKYLDVFDSIRVLGEKTKNYIDNNNLVEIENPLIEISILPRNTKPSEFINDRKLKKILSEEIKKAEAILVKPSTRRGIMAIKIAKKYNKPYMIEMTGDIYTSLKVHPNIVKRLYAPIIYKKVKKVIKATKFGLYVSNHYLQSMYPIDGKMCGCSDVVIEDTNLDLLDKRIAKINHINKNERIEIGLIGFYQGTRKGVDVAIKALSMLPQNFHLNILGNGTEENRNYWRSFAKSNGVSEERLHFPAPLSNATLVLKWIDNIDILILPTRSEGFVRVLVEAMSRGCPCIASNVAAIPELLNNDSMHNVGDFVKLSELINYFTDHKEFLIEKAKENFFKSKEYEFDLLLKKRNDFLKEFKIYCESMSNL